MARAGKNDVWGRKDGLESGLGAIRRKKRLRRVEKSSPGFRTKRRSERLRRKSPDPRKGPRRRSKVEGCLGRREKATPSSRVSSEGLSKSVDNREGSKTEPSERFRAKAKGRKASRRRKIVARRSNGAGRCAVYEKRGFFGGRRKGAPTRTERARLSTFVRKARRASEREPRPLGSRVIGDFVGRGHLGKHGALGFRGRD